MRCSTCPGCLTCTVPTQVPLPRDNVFFGWPEKERLIGSIVAKGGPNGPFDALCSAHTVYDPARLDALVPNAGYITLLRDPRR